MLVCGDRITADNVFIVIAEDIENTGFNPEGKNPEDVLNLSKTLFSIFLIAQYSSRQNFPELKLYSAREFEKPHHHSAYFYYQQLN